jgi:hypothetical protein
LLAARGDRIMRNMSRRTLALVLLIGAGMWGCEFALKPDRDLIPPEPSTGGAGGAGGTGGAGGACPTPCEADELCIDGTCYLATCSDGEMNGAETDIDCGGGCIGCSNNLPCGEADDCFSRFCDVDTCADCMGPDDCAAGEDCVAGACSAG